MTPVKDLAWSGCGDAWTDRLASVPKLSLGFITCYLTSGELMDTENLPTRRVLDRTDALFRAGKVKKVLCLQVSCGFSYS